MTTPKQYRKKPTIVEAVRFTRDNGREIKEWADKYETYIANCGDVLYVEALEGDMKAELGDWIVKDINDTFYPCGPSTFAATHEEVTE